MAKRKQESCRRAIALEFEDGSSTVDTVELEDRTYMVDNDTQLDASVEDDCLKYCGKPSICSSSPNALFPGSSKSENSKRARMTDSPINERTDTDSTAASDIHLDYLSDLDSSRDSDTYLSVSDLDSDLDSDTYLGDLDSPEQADYDTMPTWCQDHDRILASVDNQWHLILRTVLSKSNIVMSIILNNIHQQNSEANISLSKKV